MMAAGPKHWQDWCIWLLGIWLCLSPWILQFGLDPTATQATVISGLLIIVTEVVTLSAFRALGEMDQRCTRNLADNKPLGDGYWCFCG